MSGLKMLSDPITTTLLILLILAVGLPAIFVTAWRGTRLPFRTGALRWVYLAWAFLLAEGLVWRLSGDVRVALDEAGYDSYVRLAFLLAGVLVILFVGVRYRYAFARELLIGVLGIFSVFAIWSLASTLWSVSPTVTIFKSFEYCSTVALFALTAFLIKSTISPQNQLLALKKVFDWNWFLVFLLLVTVYLGVIIWPGYAILRGESPEGLGVLGFSISGALPGISANGVGELAAILGIVAVVRILLKPKAKLVYVPVLALSVMTLVLAQSRSPILGFALAVVVVLLASRRFALLMLSSSFLVAALISSYGQIVYEFMRRGGSDETLMTLDSRTIYWELSLKAARENLIGGYGAYAGGRNVLQSDLGLTDTSTVHSAYAETLLGAGIVGLALLLIGLGAAWLWLFRLRSYVMQNPVGRLLWVEILGVFVILSVRSIFSVTFVWPPILTFGLVLIFIAVIRGQLVQRRYAGAAVAQPVPATRRRRPSLQR